MKSVKGQIRRIVAAVLAVMMLLSSPMTSLAEEINTPAETMEISENEIQISEGPIEERSAGDIEGTTEQVSEEPDEISTGIAFNTEEIVQTEQTEQLSGIEAATPSIAEEATPDEAEYETDKFSQSRTVDDVIITVIADAGVFPEGAKLEVSKVTDKKDLKEIEAAVEEERDEIKNVEFSYTFDIKVVDKAGKEIQPNTEYGTVNVKFSVAEKLREDMNAEVFHVESVEEKAKRTEQLIEEIMEKDGESPLADGEVINDLGKKHKKFSEYQKEEIEEQQNIKEPDGTELIADKLNAEIETENNSSIITAETDGFSYYVLQFTSGSPENANPEVLQNVKLSLTGGGIFEISWDEPTDDKYQDPTGEYVFKFVSDSWTSRHGISNEMLQEDPGIFTKREGRVFLSNPWTNRHIMEDGESLTASIAFITGDEQWDEIDDDSSRWAVSNTFTYAAPNDAKKLNPVTDLTLSEDSMVTFKIAEKEENSLGVHFYMEHRPVGSTDVTDGKTWEGWFEGKDQYNCGDVSNPVTGFQGRLYEYCEYRVAAVVVSDLNEAITSDVEYSDWVIVNSQAPLLVRWFEENVEVGYIKETTHGEQQFHSLGRDKDIPLYKVVENGKVHIRVEVPNDLEFSGLGVYPYADYPKYIKASNGVDKENNRTQYDFIIDVDEGFCSGADLELITYNKAYENEYSFNYDGRGDSAVIRAYPDDDDKDPEFREPGQVYEYSAKETMYFALITPEGISDRPYRVEIYPNGKEPETITEFDEEDVDGQTLYCFSYTPDYAGGFNADVFWTESEWDFEHYRDDKNDAWFQQNILMYVYADRGTAILENESAEIIGSRYNQTLYKLPRSAGTYTLNLTPFDDFEIDNIVINGGKATSYIQNNKLTEDIPDSERELHIYCWFRGRRDPVIHINGYDRNRYELIYAVNDSADYQTIQENENRLFIEEDWKKLNFRVYPANENAANLLRAISFDEYDRDDRDVIKVFEMDEWDPNAYAEAEIIIDDEITQRNKGGELSLIADCPLFGEFKVNYNNSEGGNVKVFKTRKQGITQDPEPLNPNKYGVIPYQAGDEYKFVFTKPEGVDHISAVDMEFIFGTRVNLSEKENLWNENGELIITPSEWSDNKDNEGFFINVCWTDEEWDANQFEHIGENLAYEEDYKEFIIETECFGNGDITLVLPDEEGNYHEIDVPHHRRDNRKRYRVNTKVLENVTDDDGNVTFSFRCEPFDGASLFKAGFDDEEKYEFDETGIVTFTWNLNDFLDWHNMFAEFADPAEANIWGFDDDIRLYYLAENESGGEYYQELYRDQRIGYAELAPDGIVRLKVDVPEDSSFNGIGLYPHEGFNQYIRAIDGEKNNGRIVYYFEFGIGEDDFRWGFDLELITYNKAYGKEYVINYDGRGDSAVIRAYPYDYDKTPEFRESGKVYEYTENETMYFALITPEGISDGSYRVEIYPNGKEPVTITEFEEVTENEQTLYCFSYTPDYADGFNAEVYWTDYEYEYEAIERECDYEHQYIVEIWNSEGGHVDIQDNEHNYRHGGHYDRVRVLLPKTEKDITFVVEPYDNYVFEKADIDGSKVTLLDDDNTIDYRVEDPEDWLHADFWFNGLGRAEVHDYDDSRFTVQYRFGDEGDWEELRSDNSCIDLSSDAEKLTIRATQREDYQPEDSRDELKGIWGIVHNEENTYREEYASDGVCEYIITDFTCDHELHLADGWRPFNGEYAINYDGRDDYRAGLWMNNELVEFDGIHGFAAKEELTFAFKQGECFVKPYKVEMCISGRPSIDLTEEIDDGKLSYTPTTSAGFCLEVYWTDYEYEYEAIERECDYEHQYIVEIWNSEGGHVDIQDNEHNYRHGGHYDRVRVLLPKTEKDITFVVEPYDNYVFEKAWIEGKGFTLLEENNKINYYVENPHDRLHADFNFIEAAYMYVNWFDNRCSLKIGETVIDPGSRIYYSDYEGDSYILDYYVPMSGEAGTFTGINVYENDSSRVDQFEVGTEQVSEGVEDGESLKYIITLNKSEYPKGFNLELCNYEESYTNEFRVEYDNYNGTAEVYLSGEDKPLENNEIRTFEVNQPITLILTKPEDLFCGVEVFQKGEAPVLLSNIQDGKISFTPESDKGMQIRVYWMEEEYRFEHITDDMDWDKYCILKYQVNGNGKVLVDGEYETGKRWGDQYRVKLPRNLNTFSFNIVPGDGSYLRDAYNGGTNYAGRMEDGVITVERNVLDENDWFDFNFEQYKVITFHNGDENKIQYVKTDEGTVKLDANTFTRIGYSFDKWNENPEGEGQNYADEEEINISNNLDLYAVWMANKYTVTFTGNYEGSEYSEEIEETYDSTYELPGTAPERTGYTFAGWYTAAEGGEKIESTTAVAITANKTLYAHWSANEYTVTYDAQGGTVTPGSKTVIYGGTYGDLAVPEKTGYTFAGWYTAAEGGEKIESTTAVAITANKTLYAHWSAKTFTVSFDKNGGSGTTKVITVTYDGTYGDLPAVTKEAYEFAGWYTAKEGGEKIESTTQVKITAAQTLYAHWNPATYHISYYDGNEDITEEVTGIREYTYDPNNTYVIDAVPPEMVGKEFLGWYTKSDLKTKATSIAKGSTGDKTFYGKWTNAMDYVIRYDGNGATSGKMGYTTVNSGKNPTLAANAFARTGYAFIGWAIKPDEHEAEYLNKQVITEPLANGTGVYVTLYAVWQPITYTIKFSANGGEGSAIAPITGCSYDAVQPLPDCEWEKAGYKFYGWNTKADGKGTRYAAFEDVKNLTSKDKTTVTLYAQWKSQTHKISYNFNGGAKVTNRSYPDKFTEGAVKPIDAPAERTGAEFSGWYDNPAFEGSPISSTAGLEADMKLYACWEYTDYTISYQLGEGDAENENPDHFTINDKIVLKNPAKEGYKFAGWYKDATFMTKFSGTIAKGTHEEQTFYAKWSPISYSITYDLDGGKYDGKDTNQKKYTIEDGYEFTGLKDGSKKGAGKFLGWSTEKGNPEKIITGIETGTIGNLKLYAIWELESFTITYDLCDYGEGSNDPLNPTSYTVDDTVTLLAPTRKGYTFAGWMLNGKRSTGFKAGQTGDKKFSAVWSVGVSYSVKFDKNDAKAKGSMSNQTMKPDTKTALTANKYTLTGYDFNGWNTKADGTGDHFENKKVIDNVETPLMESGGNTITLYAQWTPHEYTITYVNAETEKGIINNNPVTYTVETETITLDDPVNPSDENEDLKFDGWYTDKKFTAKSKASEIKKGSTGNKTFYAKWTKKQYVITYFLNDPDPTDTKNKVSDPKNPTTYTIDTAITLKAPTKKGWTFLGWHCNQSDNPDEITETILCNKPGDKSYSARWEIRDFTITYVLGEGEVNDSDNPATYTIKDDTFSLKDATKAKNTFAGWWTKDAKGKYSKQIKSIAKGSTVDYELYPKWTEGIKYTIKYDRNNPAATGTTKNTTVAAGKDVTMASCGYKLSGKVFKEWNTSADGTGTGYAAGKKILKTAPITEENGSTVTLYAQWDDEHTFVLHYDGNGGELKDSKKPMKDQTMANNKLSTLTANGFKKTGYVFAGWKLIEPADNDYTVDYTDKQKILGYDDWYTYESQEGIVTLYAVWRPAAYTIAFSKNGGTGSMTGISAAYGTEYELPECGYTKKGYHFDGWYTTAKCTGEKFAPGYKVSNLKNTDKATVTYYAKWTANEITVILDGNGGKTKEGLATVSQTMTYDKQAALAANPFSKVGGTFGGWSLTADGAKKYADKAKVKNLTDEGGVTLYAVWNAKTGWYTDESGKRVYYESGDIVKNAFRYDGKVMYYLDENGHIAENRVIHKSTSGTDDIYYVNDKGLLVKNAFIYSEIDGAWLYLTDSGAAFKSHYGDMNESLIINGVEFYFERSGRIVDENGNPISQDDKLTEARTVSITFKGNGSTGGKMTNGKYITPFGLPKNKFTKKGYTFVEWTTEADGSGYGYADEGTVSCRYIPDDSAITLYAQWEKTEYNIFYELDGGTNHQSNVSSYTVEDAITLKDPEKDGYTFAGWYSDAKFKTKVTKISAGSTGDRTFYAKWKSLTG